MDQLRESLAMETKALRPVGPTPSTAARTPCGVLSASPSASLPPASGPSIQQPPSGQSEQLLEVQTRDEALQSSTAHFTSQEYPDVDPFAACILNFDDHAEPYPVDNVLDSLSLLSASPSCDPFQGLDLSGFLLSAVGAALGARRYSGDPELKEAALWTLVRSRMALNLEKFLKIGSNNFTQPTQESLLAPMASFPTIRELQM